ncbi:MAG: polyprenyl synthetase family protein [Lachnospiraceae bacterium]|nr:polyprenyl synthetase family protein [Lachnospiraceae bacterium]
MEQIQEIIQHKAAEIEELLKKYLPREAGLQRTVLEAMNYSVLAGGKRLRPMLMQEVYRMLGGKGREIEPLMAAIEMIHTYSLVHDDLPAMDNDEYRRGRRTTHAVYGEAMGILAGDGLLNLAWETAMEAFSLCVQEEQSPAEKAALLQRTARAVALLARKAGVYGMIGGQTADIEAEEQEQVSMEQLLFIHENKTAALIQAAMMVGAIMAGANEEQIRQMERCAYDIGIAFQIQDDILDVTGTMEELGKPIGSDEKNHKQTYVTLRGMEASAREVEQMSREAMEILEAMEGDSGFLQALTASLIHRRK